MDVLAADAKGLPWCVKCERTEGTFYLAVDGTTLCVVCADGKHVVATIQGAAMAEDHEFAHKTPEQGGTPTDQVETEKALPTTEDDVPEAGMTDVAKRQENATREGQS